MNKIKTIELSAKSRLKQAAGLTAKLQKQLKVQKDVGDTSEMPILRNLISQLSQCIHEYNAYQTAYDNLIKPEVKQTKYKIKL